MDVIVELSQKTPLWDQVGDQYDPANEFIRIQDYVKDVRLLKLKRSM